MKASHLTYIFTQVIILKSAMACIPSSNHTSADRYPINRYFNVTSDGPTPQLSCLVGFISLDSDRLFRFGMWPCQGWAWNVPQDKLQRGCRHRADPERGGQEGAKQHRDVASALEENKVDNTRKKKELKQLDMVKIFNGLGFWFSGGIILVQISWVWTQAYHIKHF